MVQDADTVVDAETGMFSRHQVTGKLFIKDFTVYEQSEDTATEHLGHRCQVTDGNIEEGTLMIEPALQHDRVIVRIPTEHVPECLMGDDNTGE